MMANIFSSKKKYQQALDMVYTFHARVHSTIVDLLRGHGDYVLKRGIKFSFLEMPGTYTVTAVRLDESGKDFYLEATDEDGNEQTIDWPAINHDMIITEWLMGLKWPDTYPDYEYKF